MLTPARTRPRRSSRRPSTADVGVVRWASTRPTTTASRPGAISADGPSSPPAANTSTTLPAPAISTASVAPSAHRPLRGGTRRSSRSTGSRATRAAARAVTTTSSSGAERRGGEERPAQLDRRVAGQHGAAGDVHRQHRERGAREDRDQRERQQLGQQQPAGADAAAAAQPRDRDLGTALLGDRGEHQPEDDDRQQAELGDQERHGDAGLVDLLLDVVVEAGQLGDDRDRGDARLGDPRGEAVDPPAELVQLLDADLLRVHDEVGLADRRGERVAAAAEGLTRRQPGVVLELRGESFGEDGPGPAGEGLVEPVVRRHLLVDADDEQVARDRRGSDRREGAAQAQLEVLRVGSADRDLVRGGRAPAVGELDVRAHVAAPQQLPGRHPAVADVGAPGRAEAEHRLLEQVAEVLGQVRGDLLRLLSGHRSDAGLARRLGELHTAVDHGRLLQHHPRGRLLHRAEVQRRHGHRRDQQRSECHHRSRLQRPVPPAPHTTPPNRKPSHSLTSPERRRAPALTSSSLQLAGYFA